MVEKKLINRNFWYLALLGTLAIVTMLYLSRNIVDEPFFSIFISIPIFTIIPATLLILSSILVIKSYKKNHPNKNSFLLLTCAFSFWFMAELIWNYYEHIAGTDPFPSLADLFYLSAPISMFFALLFYIIPFRKYISKGLVAFAVVLSLSILIPSILATYDISLDDNVFEITVALLYPIVDAILLCPAIIAIMLFFRTRKNHFWILLLTGIIVFIGADTIFLYLIIDDSYFDGHPVDILWVSSYIIWSFIIFRYIKEIQNETFEIPDILISDDDESLKLTSATKLGIPLVIGIVSLIFVMIFLGLNQFGDENTNKTNLTI